MLGLEQHKDTQYHNSSLDTATLGLENENSLLTCWQFQRLNKKQGGKATESSPRAAGRLPSRLVSGGREHASRKQEALKY